MLSYVKLHLLIVSLGRNGRERLNKMKYYFVNSRIIILFCQQMCNLKHCRSLLEFSFQKLLGLHLQATQTPASPSSHIGRKVNRTGYSTGPWHNPQLLLWSSPTLVSVLFNMLFLWLC